MDDEKQKIIQGLALESGAVKMQLDVAMLRYTHVQKYDYFLMGLAGAVIAVSVHQTADSKWEYSLLIVALAAVLCGLSIYFGLKKQHGKEKCLSIKEDKGSCWASHMEFFVRGEGTTDKQQYEQEMKKYNDDFEKADINASWFTKGQHILLCWGVFIFIIWHGARIYQNSLTSVEKRTGTNVVTQDNKTPMR